MNKHPLFKRKSIFSISYIIPLLSCALIIHSEGALILTPVAVGVARDEPINGTFDSIVGPTANRLNTEIRPTFEERSVFEFSLNGVSGMITSATLSLDLAARGGQPLISFFGYSGNGSISLNDVNNNGNPLIAQVQTSNDNTNNDLLLASIDLTSFVNQAITNGDSHIGLISTVNFGEVSFFNVSGGNEPQLEISPIPEPSHVTLIGAIFSISLLGHRSRKKTRLGHLR